MKKLVLAIVMSLVMANMINAKNPYVSVHPNIGKESYMMAENCYNMTLNYDKSKNSWISIEGTFDVKKITFVLDDETIVELNRTGTTVNRTFYISEYGPFVTGNTRSCSTKRDFNISKKNKELLSTHDIKKMYFDDKEFETEFCLFGYYYILDTKYNAKKNGIKDEYSFIK